MFSQFFSRELFTGLKRPMLYIFMGIVGLLVFLAVVSDSIVIGGVVGDVKKNAPTVVANYVAILNIFGLLFAAAFFNNAALRDYKYQFNEILFSTPLRKAGYFFGRFTGAWLLSSLVMVGVFLAFMLGSAVGPAMNWIGAERIGPTPWGAFFNSFVLFVLPNMFLAGSIIFLLATQFRSTIVSFVGTLLIIVGYVISLTLVSDVDNEALAGLVDMFGYSAYSLDTRYLTPVERNTVNPAFSGYLLTNRLLWFAVGVVVLLLGYWRFSFADKNKKAKKAKSKTTQVVTNFSRPALTTVGGPSTWSTFWSFFKINTLSIFKSTVFVILLLFAIIMLLSNIWGGFEYFGLQSYPVTYKMIDQVNNIGQLFVVIVLVFFSGELVWRDRDHHLNEVVDSTPHQSWVSLSAKALSLVVVASSLYLTLIGVAILYQAVNGYTNFELSIYLTDFLTEAFLMYLLWGGLFIFLQVVLNQKYLAYFVSVMLLFMLDFLYLALGVETNLLNVGSTPATRYSDMNGFGPGFEGHLWFTSYWVLFGLLLLTLAGLFWPRGMNKKIQDRLAAGRKSLTGGYYGTLGFFSVAFLGVAGYLYYQTQVVNTYENSEETELARMDYERKYVQYADAPMLSITDATYYVDIYPEERAARGKVDLQLTNRNDVAIDSLHFTLSFEYDQVLDIPGATLVYEDEDLNYVIYTPAQAIQPGDTIQFSTTFDYTSVGIENEVENTSVLRNGTFFNNMEIVPTLGYNKGVELQDKNDRRKYDLPPRREMPDLERVCSHLCNKNYLTDGASDWVNAETFISTSANQIAVAPGSLVKQTEADGRRQFHYKVDHPSQHFFSFVSAEFEVARRQWNGIDVEVYYDEAHSVNVPIMLDALEASLAYYTENYGPYFHKQARIIEFPRYATFAQAFPGTMPYSEAFGFIVNMEGADKNNVIKAVIAHEMAHQYWAHQLIGANMKGSTMLSESFAEYSALMVMKQTTDDVQMKDFLKYDHNRYLRGRSRESDKEQPLLTVENQAYIHYGKGSVVMYALQDYIGEEKVNTALRSFLEEYAYREPPYPTAHDFMRHLRPQIPDSLQYLIQDWFEDITLYDLRLEEVRAKKLADDTYELELDLFAQKLKATPAGESEPVAINDWVDIGFYADGDEKELLQRQRIRITQERQTITVPLDQLPARAAVDPLRLLIDRVYDDNRKPVPAL
ncbi:MAG: M1 family aminopeptidase [Bacteroidota bacterium]